MGIVEALTTEKTRLEAESMKLIDYLRTERSPEEARRALTRKLLETYLEGFVAARK